MSHQGQIIETSSNNNIRNDSLSNDPVIDFKANFWIK